MKNEFVGNIFFCSGILINLNHENAMRFKFQFAFITKFMVQWTLAINENSCFKSNIDIK